MHIIKGIGGSRGDNIIFLIAHAIVSYVVNESDAETALYKGIDSKPTFLIKGFSREPTNGEDDQLGRT